MKVEAQGGAAFADFADRLGALFAVGADDLVDIAGTFEQRRENIVEDDGDAQVGTRRLEQPQGRRGENGVAERA